MSFRLGVDVIDPDLDNNEAQLQSLRQLALFIEEARRTQNVVITSLQLDAATSLEDGYDINVGLAAGRLKSLESFIKYIIDVPDEVISYNTGYIPWNMLAEYVRSSDLAQKEKILEIIAEPEELVAYGESARIDNRILKLRSLDNGAVWSRLAADVFPDMRYARATITYTVSDKVLPVDESDEDVECIGVVTIIEESPVEQELNQEPASQPVADDFSCQRHGFVKTNVVGWGMAMVNAAAEFDFAPHWSAELSAYYSAWNYFANDLKFRTLTLRPEVRYWPSECNERWYVGAHFGLGWYNFAFKGDYRFQDHDGNTPALGGGLSVGYRMPLSRNHRWHIEFGVSGGIYHLDYDKFLNVPNGRLVGRVHKTYYGLDGVSVSVAYRFGLKKKGGR